MTAREDQIESLLGTYTAERANLLPALHDVQHTLGFLPEWAIEQIGLRLHIPASEVYGVASGYPELRLQAAPAGLVQLCTGLSCRLAGADALLSKAGELRRESIEPVSCLFLCALAPVAAQGERLIGRVDAARLAAIQVEGSSVSR